MKKGGEQGGEEKCGPSPLVVCQGTLEIGRGGTGLDLLASGRVKDTLSRGAGFGGALIESLTDLVGRSVQVQRNRTLGLEGVRDSMKAKVVMHVGDGILLQEGLLLNGHGGGLFIIIAVVTTHTRVSVIGVIDNTFGPVVEGLLQLAVKDFHEAVGAGMVVDGTVKRV